MRKTERPLSEMTSEEITKIPGIGKSSVEKITELINTGAMSRLDSYKAKTPDGIIEILGIRGIGPSKVKGIWKQMGIESPGELLYACNENRLIEASGFGMKTQQDVKQKLEYYLESKGKWLYAKIEPQVKAIVELLKELGATQVDVVGEYAPTMPNCTLTGISVFRR